MEQIHSFRDEYAFLSNFYPCRVMHGDLLFRSAESAFQAAKSTDQETRLRFIPLSASEAKKLGRQIALRPDWKKVNLGIMRDILISKFTLNESLWAKLSDTGDAELIEKNTWHDNIWGDCTCPKCRNIPGRNLLGSLLMEIRDTYKFYWRL